MKGRYLVLNFLVRKWQVEARRDYHWGEDETRFQTVANVQWITDTVRRYFPSAHLSWGCSRDILLEDSTQFDALRNRLGEFARQYGDVITFNPGGGFPDVYNTFAETQADLDEAFARLKTLYGAWPPSIVSWELASANLAHLAENYGVKAASAQCWSQWGVDGMSCEGSLVYPYYPARSHFLKPAGSVEEQLPVVMLDVISLDLVAARHRPERNCRMGVQLIETVQHLGYEQGMREMLATSDEWLGYNYDWLPFGLLTNQLEVSVVHASDDTRRGFEAWLAWLKRNYPDLQLVSGADFADRFAARYPDNSALNYCFRFRGTGISDSEAEAEVVWEMNQDWRLGTLFWKDRPHLLDFTPYQQAPDEPDAPAENFSLPGYPNQKQFSLEGLDAG